MPIFQVTVSKQPASKHPANKLVTYKDIISHSFESKEAFRSYFLNLYHICQIYLAFKQLEQVWNAAEKKVNTLKKEVKKLEQAKYCIKEAFIYVEDQFNTFWAILLATTPPSYVAPSVATLLPAPLYLTLFPAPTLILASALSHVAVSFATNAAFSTPSDLENTFAEHRSQGHKVVKISDPPVY